MTVWSDWAKESSVKRIYLAEITVQKIADLSTLTLYLSNYGYASETYFYIPCLSGLPRLTRQSNDTLTANSVPSWGDLEIFLEMDYRPDPANSLPWSTLLGEDYNFIGQAVIIKLGGECLAYADFETIFSGKISNLEYDRSRLTLEIGDKILDLERKELPVLTLPETSDIPEANRGAPVPEIFGRVQYYKPLLINEAAGKFILAGHVVRDIVSIYISGLPVSSPGSYWTQFDYSWITKTGTGSATLVPSGTYSGSLVQVEYTLEIDDVSAGYEIGQATFKFSRDGGLTWADTGLATVLYAYDYTSLIFTGTGDGTLDVGGTYTLLVAATWIVEIVTPGALSAATFKLSKDNGLSWGTETATGVGVPFGDGMSGNFNDLSGDFDAGDQWTWNFIAVPAPMGDGLSVMFTSGSGHDFELGDQFCFRLVSTMTLPGIADNEVLVDVQGRLALTAAAYVDTPGAIIRELLQEYAGWPTGDIDADSLAAFDAAFPYEVGIRIDSPTALSQIIDDLLAGFPARYTVKLDGRFCLSVLEAPGVTVIDTVKDVEILNLAVAVDAENIYRRISLNYARCWDLTDSDTGIFQDWYEFASKEWRLVTVGDDTIADYYSFIAKDLEPINTCVISRADAEALAAAMLAILKTMHRLVTVELKVQPYIWELGDVIRVESAKFNMAANYLIEGLEHDFTASTSQVTLWR